MMMMMMMMTRMMTFPMENDKSLRTVHCGIGAAGARENFGCQVQAGNDNLLIKDGNHQGEEKTTKVRRMMVMMVMMLIEIMGCP